MKLTNKFQTNMIKNCMKTFADNTFKSSPRKYYQI